MERNFFCNYEIGPWLFQHIVYLHQPSHFHFVLAELDCTCSVFRGRKNKKSIMGNNIRANFRMMFINPSTIILDDYPTIILASDMT